jgi:hypothetical protein
MTADYQGSAWVAGQRGLVPDGDPSSSGEEGGEVLEAMYAQGDSSPRDSRISVSGA